MVYHVEFKLYSMCFLSEYLYINIELQFKTDEQSDWLDKVTSFNLNARYNDYKKEFYYQCTPEFTEFWIEKIKILRSWINQML